MCLALLWRVLPDLIGGYEADVDVGGVLQQASPHKMLC